MKVNPRKVLVSFPQPSSVNPTVPRACFDKSLKHFSSTCLFAHFENNAVLTETPSLSRTFFVVMAHDGIPYDVSEAEPDAGLPPMAGRGSDLGATLLTLKTLLSFVVSPYLIAAHPPDQSLALADGKRLQQTLVYLHILTKDITQLEATWWGRENNNVHKQVTKQN